MGKFNRVCVLCGKEYKYCNDCREYDDQPAWKNIYCSENCRTLFNTAVDFKQNNLSLQDAYAKIKNCDLSKKAEMRKDIISIIDEIIEEYENEKKVSEVKPVVQKDVESKVVHDTFASKKSGKKPNKRY